MRRALLILSALLVVWCASLSAQRIVLPSIDFEAYESEALKEVRQLPNRGGMVEGEEYQHLHILAAQFCLEPSWLMKVEGAAEFIDAIDMSEPVDFSNKASENKRRKPSGSHIYADYIYDTTGKVRWIYSNGIAFSASSGVAAAQNLVDLATEQHITLIFKVKDVRDELLFGVVGGKVKVIYLNDDDSYSAHDFDTFTAAEGVAKTLLRPMAYKKIASEASFQAASEGEDTYPLFRGGDLSHFRQWVVENMLFPKDLYGRQIGGRVVATFIVNAKGRVESVDIVEADNEQLAKSVYDLLVRSPKWTPGRQQGKAVAFQYTLPLNFQVAE